jgi:CheY-like chemotaxis protein
VICVKTTLTKWLSYELNGNWRDESQENQMNTPYKVLVVEDDKNLGRIMAETLMAAGYEVQTADDGLHGFMMYLEQQPEVVLTDIQMPELDGLEMMRCIRTINPKVKTIYISGAANQYREALTSEGKEYGAIVLNKPFARSDLLQSINGWRSARLESSTHGR